MATKRLIGLIIRSKHKAERQKGEEMHNDRLVQTHAYLKQKIFNYYRNKLDSPQIFRD